MNSVPAAPPELTLSPGPEQWQPLVGEPGKHAPRFREQVGLPADGPIVMGGHQVGLWHPGILAKVLAGEAFADAVAGHSAWLWVDQDDNDPTKLHVPTLDGRLDVGIWDMSPGQIVPGATPVVARRAIEPGEFAARVHPGVRAGAIGQIQAAIRARAQEPSLARQFADAAFDLLDGLATKPTTLFASELCKTDLFSELVERMRTDARGMVEAYNSACQEFSDSGIRPLAIRDEAIELPLWRMRAGEARMPVYSSQLADIPPEQLAPRAILMTSIVRLGGCDLFIHGTGGGAYDRVSERWIEQWLGETLCPMVVASATCRLPLADGPLASEDEIAEAKSRAHRARHEPAIVGDDKTSAQKAALLEQIEQAKLASENPKPLFREMQTLLSDYRQRSADAIEAVQREAQRLEAQRGLAAIAQDRTWAFPLYAEESLRELNQQIERGFGGSKQ